MILVKTADKENDLESHQNHHTRKDLRLGSLALYEKTYMCMRGTTI